MIEAKIICDSISPNKHRLTTFVCTYPRFIHSELMTHRMFSRNAASSRAIPFNKMLYSILENPAMPEYWGINKSGMQADEEVNKESLDLLKIDWKEISHKVVADANRLVERYNLHKQIINRLLEPFAHITTIISATEYDNFFAQRTHKDAQPEFRILARKMADLYYNNIPKEIDFGGWHTPFINNETLGDIIIQCEGISPRGYLDATIQINQISAARCARVSYLNHEGKKSIEDDLKLFDKLVNSNPPHMSPLEHVARCIDVTHFMDRGSNITGNFIGWQQLRKQYHNEVVINFNYEEARKEW